MNNFKRYIQSQVKEMSSSSNINPLSGRPITDKYIKNFENAAKLPIWRYRDQIINTVRDNTFTLLTAGTGAGKTRLTPTFLIPLISELGGLMIVTEPKRISTISGATTIASDNDVELGKEVGYRIRFETKGTSTTQIFFETEGIFLQDISNDPNIDERYSVIILDEVHERSLNIDVILAMLRNIRPSKTRIVLMSATIDVEKFSRYFYNCPVITVEGQPQIIETFFAMNPSEKLKERINEAIVKAIEISEGDIPGDIIVFVDGADAAEEACKKFTNLYSESVRETIAYCVTLYANLNQERQAYVKDVVKPGERKVIFSTNLAEASVTIPTAIFVVDTGLQKESDFEYSTRASILELKLISKASANQRRGRVGRNQPGFVYRIYTEEEYNEMRDFTIPEILRENIEDVLVKLLNMQRNLTNVSISDLAFIDSPTIDSVKLSLNVLLNAKIISPSKSSNLVPVQKSSREIQKQNNIVNQLIFSNSLTELGELVSQFPLIHEEGKMIVLSHRNNTSDEIIAIVSMMSVQNPLINAIPPNKQNQFNDSMNDFNTYRGKLYGDHLGLLRMFEGFVKTPREKRRDYCFKHFLSLEKMNNILQTFNDLKRFVERKRIKSQTNVNVNPSAIGKSLLEGYYQNLALRVGNRYVMIYSDIVAQIAKSSILVRERPKLILYSRLSKKPGGYFMNYCYKVELNDLINISPKTLERVNQVMRIRGVK
jgi:pre-mRNA-splicing factor ATP-dependent RNA helicase DHX15/PRP43